MPERAPKIALLGWGSLLWDERPEFDDNHEPWQLGGPELPLEFSRVSVTRKRALTLVIDIENGTSCQTAYAFSKRRDPDDAIADLRSREGTVMRHMGVYFRNGTRTGRPQVLEPIRHWANTNEIDIVVWTGLPSNFKEETNSPFSVDNALHHLQSLTNEGKARAAEYVWRAPSFIDTPLRRRLQAEPWFVSAAPTTKL